MNLCLDVRRLGSSLLHSFLVNQLWTSSIWQAHDWMLLSLLPFCHVLQPFPVPHAVSGTKLVDLTVPKYFRLLGYMPCHSLYTSDTPNILICGPAHRIFCSDSITNLVWIHVAPCLQILGCMLRASALLCVSSLLASTMVEVPIDNPH